MPIRAYSASRQPPVLPQSIAIHFLYMNFGRPHKALANPYPRTPAMAAGLSDHIWTVEEIAALFD